MLHLWIIFILLPQGYPLISVTKAQLGDPVTFTCRLPPDDTITRVKWYKQSVGDTLVLIATFMSPSVTPILEKSFSPSRFAGTNTRVTSTMTILKTIPEDEALYHCAAISWQTDVWNGTFLSLKGNNEGKINYTVVQRPTVSDPVQPGHSVTIRCSVLFDSQMGSCPDERSIHLFGVRSDKSLGNIVYTKEIKADECDRKADMGSSAKSCIYQLSKNFSLSDIGTYYCALAMCGEVIFGNGTKLDTEASKFGVSKTNQISLPLLCAVFGISVLAAAIFTAIIEKVKCDSCSDSMCQRNLKTEVDTRIYSGAIFTVIKPGSGGRKETKSAESEQAYAALKAFGVE